MSRFECDLNCCHYSNSWLITTQPLWDWEVSRKKNEKRHIMRGLLCWQTHWWQCQWKSFSFLSQKLWCIAICARMASITSLVELLWLARFLSARCLRPWRFLFLIFSFFSSCLVIFLRTTLINYWKQWRKCYTVHWKLYRREKSFPENHFTKRPELAWKWNCFLPVLHFSKA